MKNLHKIAAAIAVALIAWNTDVNAGEIKLGQLEIKAPWARASAGKAKNGAAYITQIINHGAAADRLVAVSSDVAMKTEIHNHIKDGGIMKMRKVDGVDVKPGHPAVLKPGGYHIMMMGLKAPLKMGDMFHVTLEFEKAGKIKVMVPIMKVGASSGPMMNHDMKKMKHDMKTKM